MGSFIARLKSCKAIRITFCWQNNFSQRQGTLLLVVLQFPPCLWLSVLPHLCSQTAKLLSWLYFNIHMLGESKSNRFLSILTASLRSSVPAAPCFLFLFSIIPSCYVSASLAHSAAVRALSKWAPLHLEKLGEERKRKCCVQTIPFYKMAKWHHLSQLQTHRNHYFLPLFSLQSEFMLLWTKRTALISNAS